MNRALIFMFAFVSPAAALAADSPQQAFIKAWEGRTVAVKATLHSLIYNERGRLGTTRSGLREGLVVTTPLQGAYFQFDARQGRNEVRQLGLDGFVAAVNTAYEPDVLDVRSYRKLEAVAINQYDPGVQLVVTQVRVDRDWVRFDFAKETRGAAVTAIRVKWPLPLSAAFTERPLIEDLIQQFVLVAQP